MRRVLLALAGGLIALTSACGPGGYGAWGRPSMQGAMLGGVAGGIVGYNMAGSDNTQRWRGAAVGTAAGALGGYFLGRQAENGYYTYP